MSARHNLQVGRHSGVAGLWRYLPVALGVIGASCGGAASNGTVLPSAGAPASVSVVSGDGQTAAAGSTLPVKVSVVVKDAAGVAVPGVMVHFTVDSGGGSLSASAVSTGSNGVAVGGNWTLGSGSVTNVVTASVSGLPSVKLHAHAFSAAARTLINNLSVPTSGGTLTYNHPGDPLDGLTITVPAGAYKVATQWSVVVDSTIAVPLPSKYTQAGPVLIIGNGQGLADSMMSLTMPMLLPSNVMVAPFYYDPATGTLEGVPIIGRTATSVTLATGHFTADEMAIPGAGLRSAGLRGALRAGFGSVELVWIRVPPSSMMGTFESSFIPGVDDWEFVNDGEYISPNGDCEGMTITAMYYYYYYRLGGAPYLYHHFDTSLPNRWDNVQGIRYVGSVQGDASARLKSTGAQYTKLEAEHPSAGATWALTSSWILMTLDLTKRPVLLGLISADGKTGHAVVAYAATADENNVTVSFADPNFPGLISRKMVFDDIGGLVPVEMSQEAGDPADLLVRSYALNVLGEVSASQLASRFAEFTNGKAGTDRYPAGYHLETRSSGGVLTTLTSGQELWAADPSRAIGMRCPSCPIPVLSGLDVQSLAIWNAAGSSLLTIGVFPSPLPVGISSYIAVLSALSPYANDASGKPANGFVDAWPITVRYAPLTISAPLAAPGTLVTLTADAGVLATPTSSYKWTFEDGKSPTTVTVVGSPTVTRVFDISGTYEVSVELSDPTHGVLGTTTYGVVVGNLNVSLTPSVLKANPGDVTTFTASVTGVAPSNVTYEWSFGDEGTKTYTTSTPTITHVYTQNSVAIGSFPVSVTLSTPDHLGGAQVVVGHATSSAQIKVWPGSWRITSFVRTVMDTLSTSYRLQPPFQDVLDSVDKYMGKVMAIPTDGLLFFADDSGFVEHGVYFMVSRVAGAGANATYWVGNNYFTMVSRTCCSAGVFTDTGTLTNGALDGWSSTTAFQGGQYNEIHATKSTTTINGVTTGTLTGSIVIWCPGQLKGQPFGLRTYQFTAIKVSP